MISTGLVDLFLGWITIFTKLSCFIQIKKLKSKGSTLKKPFKIFTTPSQINLSNLKNLYLYLSD